MSTEGVGAAILMGYGLFMLLWITLMAWCIAMWLNLRRIRKCAEAIKSHMETAPWIAGKEIVEALRHDKKGE